ncbi:MAG: TPR-domain containing protein [Gemmataceae bacterium]|nr:TPR-domain containing protein [Gemmataceae bacterium]
MPSPTRTRGFVACLALALGVAFLLPAGPAAAQQPTPDQQAAMLLAAGQKGYNDANPQFAADRFREFLQKFGGHKDANAARYGLGLALLDLPTPDHLKAIEALGPPANEAASPDRPLALYYLAAAHRGLGHKELAEGVARPNEMPQRTQAAQGKFTEAVKFFTQAREAFEKKTPPDAEWAARARCDQAEMEIRLNKVKEARATAEPFVKEMGLAKSKFRPLGMYYHGVACFLLGEVPAAGKSLNQLAPFDQPFGPHARYLMGRVHTAQDEKAEAAAAFDAVLAGYDKLKKDAVERLKQPDRFKTDPWEKARLETLVKSPVPDYVAGSAFYGACLNYEAGKFGEALTKFQAFAKDYATSPLKDDALLRAGFCFVQTKQFDEAARTLQPLTNTPRLADQAFYWIGKAQVGLALAADPNNPAARTQILNAAVTSFRTAADRANQLAGTDPDAKTRRAEILLELADTLLTNKQAREAATAYETIWNEKLLPNKAEETLQRIVAAYHLAGDFQTSDARISEFKQKFPQSPLTPLVLFRGAENAYARAEQLAKQNNPAGAKQGFADAGKKYEEVVAKYPEFERVNRARYGLGLCFVAVEDWEKAAAALDAVPAPERNGDLAAVSFVLADCLIRTAPAKAEDALQDNVLREKLGAAAGLLDAFVAASPKAPEAPDALLKFGYCQKRLGIQLVPGNDRTDAFNKARAAYERLGREYAQSPLAGTAALERAKVMALQGDKGGAVNALRAFAQDPLAKSAVAPLAYISLATLLREQNQAAQAAQAMQDARQKFEGPLTADPQRKDWVHLLRYHHGVALFEAGKPTDARQAFDQVIQQAGGTPVAAEAALRGGQCLVDEGKKKLELIEKEKTKPNLKADQLAQLDTQLKAAKAELVTAAKQLEQRADQFKQALPQNEARARMLYDAAWAHKAAGDDPTPVYTKLIGEFPDLSLAVEARLELAEVLADKEKPADAVKLLKEALDKEPTDKPTPPETAERIRLRLGAALFANKDVPGAQAQFDAVAGNEKSPHRGPALYRSAECLIAQGKWEEAKTKLVIFRDNGAFHNIPTVSDRALLRLGHVLTELKQWDASRQAFETLAARYGDGNTWATDARYGMGWALQNQARYDEAVNAYAQVTQKTTDDRAGRAHLQIGLCRAAQKRWEDAGKAFAVVYYGYDLPDLKFAAMVEHARTLTEEKKTADATKLLDRVVKDAPKDGPWAKAAKEMLDKIKK